MADTAKRPKAVRPSTEPPHPVRLQPRTSLDRGDFVRANAPRRGHTATGLLRTAAYPAHCELAGTALGEHADGPVREVHRERGARQVGRRRAAPVVEERRAAAVED